MRWPQVGKFIQGLSGKTWLLSVDWIMMYVRDVWLVYNLDVGISYNVSPLLQDCAIYINQIACFWNRCVCLLWHSLVLNCAMLGRSRERETRYLFLHFICFSFATEKLNCIFFRCSTWLQLRISVLINVNLAVELISTQAFTVSNLCNMYYHVSSWINLNNIV